MKYLHHIITLSFLFVCSFVYSEDNSVETFTVNGVSFNMIKVEHGTFIMGATPEMESPYDDEKTGS